MVERLEGPQKAHLHLLRLDQQDLPGGGHRAARGRPCEGRTRRLADREHSDGHRRDRSHAAVLRGLLRLHSRRVPVRADGREGPGPGVPEHRLHPRQGVFQQGEPGGPGQEEVQFPDHGQGPQEPGLFAGAGRQGRLRGQEREHNLGVRGQRHHRRGEAVQRRQEDPVLPHLLLGAEPCGREECVRDLHQEDGRGSGEAAG